MSENNAKLSEIRTLFAAYGRQDDDRIAIYAEQLAWVSLENLRRAIRDVMDVHKYQSVPSVGVVVQAARTLDAGGSQRESQDRTMKDMAYALERYSDIDFWFFVDHFKRTPTAKLAASLGVTPEDPTVTWRIPVREEAAAKRSAIVQEGMARLRKVLDRTERNLGTRERKP